MNELEQEVARTLRRYLSEIVARSVRRRAQLGLGIADGTLMAHDLPSLCHALRHAVRLFVDPALQPALMRELESITSEGTRPESERHDVVDETDICVVRMRARELAVHIGASALGAQRAATATSELARNIVMHAGSGFVELIPAAGSPRMTIRAVDRGPGIGDLEHVLSSEYRSKTGLGRGLSGVKKLATRFDVTTGAGGTSVEAEIAV